jgi:hypothetical protein
MEILRKIPVELPFFGPGVALSPGLLKIVCPVD